MREGKVSPRFGHIGVYNVCLGPLSKTLPGPAVLVRIYDKDDNIVRELKEVIVSDDAIFNAVEVPPGSRVLIDAEPHGTRTVIEQYPKRFESDFKSWILFLGEWADRFGVSQS